MNILENAEQMSSLQNHKASIFTFNMKQDWFFKDIYDGKFKYKKIKAQCIND